MLDHRAFPAAELAAGYARRWGIELFYRELKTSLRGPGVLLSGRTPDLARQHLWAYLVTCQAIRALIARAAAARGLDPARLSFTTALRAVRASVAAARDDMPAALAACEAEILAAPVPLREGRVSPRAVRARQTYPAWKAPKEPVPRHVTYTVTLTTPGATNPKHSDQRKQPREQADRAP